MSPPPPSDPATAQNLQLARAVRRARWAIGWERIWPVLARLLCVGGLFVAVSWLGLWQALPIPGRIVGVAVFALLTLAALVPAARLRWPTREEALLRLDRSSGLRHRPVTALADTLRSEDPVARALWQVQRERTLASIRRLRAGLPRPRLPIHDPWAVRALIIVLLAATFFAAGEERRSRIASAFEWNGALSGPDIRVDAWVTPPAYTARAPVLLTAAGNDGGGAVTVPVGSTLLVRSSGTSLDVATSGELAPVTGDDAPKGSIERRFTITGDGSAQVRSPSSRPAWTFRTVADKAPVIALARDPERQARGALLLAYKIEDDYGVTEAQARFAPHGAGATESKRAARPLYDPPGFALVLPNARTRSGVGQTVKDLSENPYAGAEVELTLTARDEAGNEGRSEPFVLKLPERVFAKPLPRALIELRRMLALDANERINVTQAVEALMVAPEVFTPEFGHYLGLRDVHSRLAGAKNDDELREAVESLWALAVMIEDGNISDVEKALRAAQDALKQALERGASDEEIKKLTDQLRAALDNYMRQLAEQLRNNPQQLARPLDPNTKVMRQQDLKNMIDRMERLSRSGDKDAARQLLDQLQQMLENLQMARPGQSGQSDMEQALNELGDVIRKQQQLRDKTYKQGQDSRRDRMRGQNGDQNAMNDLQRDQQGLRNRLKKLLDQLNKEGMGPGQKGQQGESGDDDGDQAQAGDEAGDDGSGLEDADSAMGDADGRLGEGNADGAADAQGKAIQAMRNAAGKLARGMQQQPGDQPGDGPGTQVGRQQGSGQDRDPLGRPLRGREHADDYSVKIPGEIDVQRVRRILEELRRRLGDSLRPQTELDYIERLLKDY